MLNNITEMLNNITDLIKKEIKRQYKSLSEFSRVSEIPYSTLSYALSKGIGNTAYDTAVKICRLLNIKQVYDNEIILFSKELPFIYAKLSALDDIGVNNVCAVLDAEYRRCRGKDENKDSGATIRGYNGIGYYASNLESEDQEKRILHIIDRLKKG